MLLLLKKNVLLLYTNMQENLVTKNNNKRFDYVCKNCWHTWRSVNKYTTCPKCKAPQDKLDIQEEIII